MLSWLFGSKHPPDPPTEKQRRYAKRLGIKVTPDMSKQDVSAAITEAERKKPGLAKSRERAKEATRERKYGRELVESEREWNEFADDTAFMIAVYRDRKDVVADVLLVNQAEIMDDGKLSLTLTAPKVVKDRHIGDYLDWDDEFELPIEWLLWSAPLHADFSNDGLQAYRKAVEKGLKKAREL